MKILDAGKIVNSHGLRGEVKIDLWCDSAEFLSNFSVFFIREKSYNVEFSRPHKNSLLAKLSGVNSIEEALALKGCVVKIDISDVELPEGQYFISDLMGADVFDERENKIIGKIIDVLPLPSNDVYVVKGEFEYMIPVVKEFIKSTDIEKKLVTVSTIEGMRQ